MTAAGDPEHEAILLIGPTGSGKTPLGRLIEARGLWGRRCVHFDFGERLRAEAAAAMAAPGLTPDDLGVIRAALAGGALLEDGHSDLVFKVLRAFLIEKRAGPGDLVLLNGMPRHIGQARIVDGVLDVVVVVVLECPAGVILERIRRDTGGDRAGRPDDSPKEIREKLEIFRRRTFPLVRLYAERGAAVIAVDVGTETAAGDIYPVLEKSIPATIWGS